MPSCEACEKKFDTEEALQQHNEAKHTAKAPESKKGKGPGMKVLGIVAVVIIIIAAGAFLALSGPGYTPGPAMEHVKGSGDVEILEFSDFQCPACGSAFSGVKSYIENNPDQARVVYKHYPLTNIHQYASKAAEASECASDQGKFWEYHDMLFENQRSLLKTDLIRYAGDIGLDVESFTACLDSGVMAERVNADIAEGNSMGIGATPTFFIEGQEFRGVLTAEDLEREVARA